MRYLIMIVLMMVLGCKVNKETLTNIEQQKRVQVDYKINTDSLFSIKDWNKSDLSIEEHFDTSGRITKKVYTHKKEAGNEQVKHVKAELNVAVKDSSTNKIDHKQTIRKDTKPILSNLLPTYFWLVVILILIFLYIKFKPF